MVIIGDKKFYRLGKGTPNKFLPKDGSVSGYYKRCDNGFLFLDILGNPFAYLCVNEVSGFFVNASKDSNGKLRLGWGE